MEFDLISKVIKQSLTKVSPAELVTGIDGEFREFLNEEETCKKLLELVDIIGYGLIFDIDELLANETKNVMQIKYGTRLEYTIAHSLKLSVRNPHQTIVDNTINEKMLKSGLCNDEVLQIVTSDAAAVLMLYSCQNRLTPQYKGNLAHQVDMFVR